MSVVALHEDQPVVGDSALARWAENARLAASIARQLAFTPFTPASLIVRDGGAVDVERTCGNVLGALLVGEEMGLQPMAALRSIDIINGTPAMRAIAMRAVVQSHGHDLWLVESSETRCIMRGRRKGSDHEQDSVWTIDRAKKLNLTGKSNWRSQPAAMLIARATSECARLVASDVLLGLGYSIEELEDGDESVPTVTSESGPRTAKRRTSKGKGVSRPPVEPEARKPLPELELEPPAGDPLADLKREIVAAAEAKGFDIEQTKDEYRVWSDGLPIEEADESLLRRFLATLVGEP